MSKTKKPSIIYPEGATPTPFWGPMGGLAIIFLAVALAIHGWATCRGLPKSESNKTSTTTSQEK